MHINLRLISGFAYGARQPSIVVSINHAASQISPDLVGKLDTLNLGLSELVDTEIRTDEPPPDEHSAAVVRFMTVLDLLNLYCGDKRFTPMVEFSEEDAICCALPTLSTAMSLHNLNALQKFLENRTENLTAANIIDFAKSQKSKTEKYLPIGTNSINLIAAAAQKNIPFMVFTRRYVIFGYGSGSSIFSSSVTDQESAIGLSLAQSKVITNRFLKAAGFPVAAQAQVNKAESAIQFAKKVGYPVVLKPERGEQGQGVYSNISDTKSLRSCYSNLAKSHRGILVEKHIVGNHYRLDVHNGELVKAVKRWAPYVIGDGTSTVEQLVAKLNEDPERLDRNSSKKIVTIDDDLTRCLSIQELNIKSVPKLGVNVFLKSVSNLSRGGSQMHVETEVHPENLDLCYEVARTMRLKFAGIDLLSPDISVPWYENNAAICEVNGQPQLGKSGTDVYWDVLQKYIRPQPKISLKVVDENGPEASRREPNYFDTNCDHLDIVVPYTRILERGCPVQYFNTLTIAEDIRSDVRQQLERALVSVMPGEIPAQGGPTQVVC